MYKSGMRVDMASQARYMDPRLWPSNVNRGHVESSTRFLEFKNTKWSVRGSNEMSNRAYKDARF